MVLASHALDQSDPVTGIRLKSGKLVGINHITNMAGDHGVIPLQA